MATELKLQAKWQIRMQLWAEGAKLWAEGNRVRAEGTKLWAEAIIEAYGNIVIEWKNWHEDKRSYECHLDNGEVYVPSGGKDKEQSWTVRLQSSIIHYRSSIRLAFHHPPPNAAWCSTSRFENRAATDRRR